MMGTIDLGLSATGYVILAILWCIVAIWLKRAFIEIAVSIRKQDLELRIRRVPNCHGDVMVSGQRAAIRPRDFVKVTPWCWRRR